MICCELISNKLDFRKKRYLQDILSPTCLEYLATTTRIRRRQGNKARIHCPSAIQPPHIQDILPPIGQGPTYGTRGFLSPTGKGPTSNNTQAYIPGPIYIGLHTTACIQRSTYRTRACLQQYKGLHTFRKGSNSPGSQHQHINSKTQARSSFLQIFQPYYQTIIQKTQIAETKPISAKV